MAGVASKRQQEEFSRQRKSPPESAGFFHFYFLLALYRPFQFKTQHSKFKIALGQSYVTNFY